MTPHKKDVESIAHGGILLAIGLAFTNLASFLFMALLARALGPAQFGIFFLGFSVFGIASALSLVGMDSAILRYVAPAYAKGDVSESRYILIRIVKYLLASSIVVAITMFLLADLVATWIFRTPEVAETIRYFSLCVTPFALSVFGYRALQSIKNFRHQVLSRNFIEPAVKLIGAVIIFLLMMSWAGWPMVVIGLSLLLSATYSGVQLRKVFDRKWRKRKSTWSRQEMLGYSLPLFLTAIFNLGLFRVDVFFLARFSAPDVVGVYGAAFHLVSLGVLGVTVAVMVMSPHIADSYHNNERDKLEALCKMASRWILIFSMPILAVICLYPDQILSVYGERYSAGASALIILTCGILAANFSGIAGTILRMSGHSKVVFVNTIITSFFAVGASYLLVPPYGMIGAAIAAALSTTLLALLRLLLSYRLVGIITFDRTALKAIFAVACTMSIFLVGDYAVYSPKDWTGVTALFPLFLIVYLLIMTALGWNRDDLLAFRATAAKWGIFQGRLGEDLPSSTMLSEKPDKNKE